jgi:hypothetical protein
LDRISAAFSRFSPGCFSLRYRIQAPNTNAATTRQNTAVMSKGILLGLLTSPRGAKMLAASRFSRLIAVGS